MSLPLLHGSVSAIELASKYRSRVQKMGSPSKRGKQHQLMQACDGVEREADRYSTDLPVDEGGDGAVAHHAELEVLLGLVICDHGVSCERALVLGAPEATEVNAGIEGFAGPPVTAAMTHALRRGTRD